MSVSLKEYLYYAMDPNRSDYTNIPDNQNTQIITQFYLQQNGLDKIDVNTQKNILETFSSLFYWKEILLGKPNNINNIQQCVERIDTAGPLHVMFSVFMDRINFIKTFVNLLSNNLSSFLSNKSTLELLQEVLQSALTYLGQSGYIVNLIDVLSGKCSDIFNVTQLTPQFDQLKQYFNGLGSEALNSANVQNPNRQQSIQNYQIYSNAINQLLDALFQYAQNSNNSISEAFTHMNISENDMEIFKEILQLYGSLRKFVFILFDMTKTNPTFLNAISQFFSVSVLDWSKATGLIYKVIRGKADNQVTIKEIAALMNDANGKVNNISAFFVQLINSNMIFKVVYEERFTESFKLYNESSTRIASLIQNIKPFSNTMPAITGMPNLPAMPQIPGLPQMPAQPQEKEVQVPPVTAAMNNPAVDPIIPIAEATINLATALLNKADHVKAYQGVATSVGQFGAAMDSLFSAARDEGDRAAAAVGRENISACFAEFSGLYNAYTKLQQFDYARFGALGGSLRLAAAVCEAGQDVRVLKLAKAGFDLSVAALRGAFEAIKPAFVDNVTKVFEQLRGQPDGDIQLFANALRTAAQLVSLGDELARRYQDVGSVKGIVGLMMAVDVFAPCLDAAASAVRDSQPKVGDAYVEMFLGGCAAVPMIRSAFRSFCRVITVCTAKLSVAAYEDGLKAAEAFGLKVSAQTQTKDQIKAMTMQVQRQIAFPESNVATLRAALEQMLAPIRELSTAVERAPRLSEHCGALKASEAIIEFTAAIGCADSRFGQIASMTILGPHLIRLLTQTLQSIQLLCKDVNGDMLKYTFPMSMALSGISQTLGVVNGMEQMIATVEQVRNFLIEEGLKDRLGAGNVKANIVNLAQQVPNMMQQFIMIGNQLKTQCVTNIEVTGFQQPTPPESLSKPIPPFSLDFNVGDNGAAAAEAEHLRKEEERLRREEEERKRREEEERKRKEEEERLRKEEEERKRREEEERKRREEEERKRREEEERKRREEEERKRREEEERKRREEEERKRREEEERKRKEEEERKRKEEEERRRREEEERKRREEEERIRREAEEKRRQEEARLDSYDLMMQYLQMTPSPQLGNRPQFVGDIRKYVDAVVQLSARLRVNPTNTEIPKTIRAIVQMLQQQVGAAESYFVN